MNSKRGAVTFEMDGETFTLRFSTNALIQFQDTFDIGLLESLRGFGDGDVDLKMVRGMFWAALRGHDLSQEQAGDLLDAVGFVEGFRLSQEALAKAFPDAVAKVDAETDAGNAPAGKPPRKTKKT